MREREESKEFVRVRENNDGWEVTVEEREEQFNAQRSAVIGSSEHCLVLA